MYKKSDVILNEYKKYDYLNKNRKRPLIKILVSYIKPSFLFSSEILTPIHLGRAIQSNISKDGTISDDEIKWLHQHCIGDDNFAGNISYQNRKVGFLTGTYWAWKNYEKLGNPEFLGSFGYRRLLTAECLTDINEYDLILPEKLNTLVSNKEYLIKSHGINIYKYTKQVLNDVYGGDLIKSFDDYMNLKSGYYCEIYIMKKQLFKDFCKWIFPLLFKMLEIENSFIVKEDERQSIIDFFASNLLINVCNEKNFDYYQMRSIAFAVERLTGFYLYKMSKLCKFKEVKMYTTEDPKNNIFSGIRARIQRNQNKPSV